MIRHELCTSIVRLYNQQSDDPYQPFDAVCMLSWESSTVVWIKGLHGSLTRQTMRELVKFLWDQGVRTIKATRAHDRTLPYVTRRTEDGLEIDLTTISWLSSKQS